MPKECGRYNHTHKDGTSRAPVIPRSKAHPPITLDLTECVPRKDEISQEAIPHLANRTPANGPELGTGVEKLWQYRNQPPLRHGTCNGIAMSPTKLRQVAVGTLGVACQKARAPRPRIGKGTPRHVKPWPVMTRPYPRKRTMVSRGNAPTRRPWENEHEWVNKPTRKPHRDARRAEARSKTTQRVPHDAPRKDSPWYTAHTNASARPSRELATQTGQRRNTTRDSRATSGQSMKSPREGIPAM